jgi:glycosyltransferase involved in cell wall biosynthesis
MSGLLYLTADAVGTETGGGVVTKNELEALRKFAQQTRQTQPCVWSFPDAQRPWGADEAAVALLAAEPYYTPRLAHLYSGTFTKTVEILKARGTKVVYTAAAHSIDVSREEHVKIGLPFDYPHLNEPKQWAEYVRGYLMADVVVCPSQLSADCMRSYGCENVVVIPHGVVLPSAVRPLPKRFAPMSLGQPGPDKGLIYLLQAWKILNYKDATLTIAGRGTDMLLPILRAHGGGSVYLRGEVDSTADVYNASSILIQPSASEGYGIEVLEAMAHGRYAVCSDGAGAADAIDTPVLGSVVRARDAEALASAIDAARSGPFMSSEWVEARRARARGFYAWPIIHQKYIQLWEALL